MMRKIITLLVFCIGLTGIVLADAPKSKIYEEAKFWYSLDTDGTDSIASNPMILSNISFISDTDRGNVAQLTVAGSSGMESTLPLIDSEVYTISLWIKVNMAEYPKWRQIFEFHNDVTGSYHMLTGKIDWGNEYGAVFQKFAPNLWQQVFSSQAFPLNEWAHLAMSFNYGDVAVYLNGFNVAEGHTDNLVDSVAPNRFLFGAFDIPGRKNNGLDCLMDDIAVFDDVLTSDRILAMANDTLPVRPNVSPFVFETEDYTHSDWSTSSDGDTAYGFFNGNDEDLYPSVNQPLVYGYYVGEGIYTLWARIKNESSAVDSAFFVKINDKAWKSTNEIEITSNWKWVKLFQSTALPNGNHTIKIAPGKKNIQTDKFLITADWGMDPNIEYVKTDIQAPTVPGTLQVQQVKENSAILVWEIATDDTKVTAYDVFDGDKLMFNTTSFGLNPTLVASTNYNFKVRAKDAAGNVSGFTNVVATTTQDLVFNIDFGQPKQVIHHFASSDAWAVDNLYRWPLAKREDMVEKLFSTEMDTAGNPKGIGLSQWRFKIGDGSLDQVSSGYSSGAWYKELECFMHSDGTYDWTKQAGSQWFLKRARDYGVNAFVGWTDSPPYFMTENGYTFRTSTVDGYNLQPDKFDDYTEFFSTVIKHFVDSGYNFVAASPVNEPQWAWEFTIGNAAQSGTHVSNADLYTVADNLSTKLYDKGLSTKAMVTEAGAIDYLYSRSGDAANQIDYFWNPANSTALVHKPAFGKMVAGHSYWTNNNLSTSVDHRNNVRDRLKALDNNLEYWQTEYSLLGEAHREGRKVMDMEIMDYSVWLSRIIHIDLTEGDCASWSFWSTFSRAGANSDHRYRFGLIWWVPDVNDHTNTDGYYEIKKNLWVMGNYSRFIRPESRRIEVTRADGKSFKSTAGQEFVSAYFSQDTSQIIVVATNYSGNDQKIKLDIQNLLPGLSITELKPYITSDTDNLKAYPAQNVTDAFYLPRKSIVTLVGDIDGEVSVSEKVKAEKYFSSFSLHPNPATEKVQVHFNAERSGTLKVRSLSGEEIFTKPVVNTSFETLDISGFTQGIYVVEFNHNNTYHFQKLIIQ